MIEYVNRALNLPEIGGESFFLWGPRQTGKSTLLKKTYPDAFYIDLLKPEEFRRYMENPQIIIEEVNRNAHNFIIVDEIQKVPELIDAIHWLHKNRSLQFALCGSSARKVRKGKINLLGGRGLTFELFGFSGSELIDKFDLRRLLNHGYLPRIYLNNSPKPLLNTYVSQYLKEEIAAEGLVRRLPSFSEFLNVASFSDCEVVNYTNIARETGVSRETIRGYFDILLDTLLGKYLPAYRRKQKRRIIHSPKFYFTDIGVVNFLSKRGLLEPGSELFGKAFENWVFHELCSYNSYKEKFAQFYYWRLTSGIEVDFIVNHMECAIEVKSSKRIISQHLKGLRQLKLDHPELKKKIIVSLDEKDRITNDGIEILYYHTFCEKLWKGKVF